MEHNIPPVAVATVRERTSLPSRLITFTAVALPPLGILMAMGLFWGVAVNLTDLVLLAVFYVIPGFGITIGFHRYFTHKSFETTRWMQATLAILGSMTLQGPVTQWVTDHRKHHALSDKPGDPHSPHQHGEGWLHETFGLWHAHVGWLFRTKGMERGDHYGKDLLQDPMIRTIDRLYLVWVALSLGLPFLIGYWAGGGSLALGFEAFVWAGLIRIFLFQHVTWSVNSICHRFGSRDYNARDESRNNAAIAILSLGEGWHNNHHAFPASAVHGMDQRQFDLSYRVIQLMKRTGVAWNLHVPSEEQKLRRRAEDAAAAA